MGGVSLRATSRRTVRTDGVAAPLDALDALPATDDAFPIPEFAAGAVPDVSDASSRRSASSLRSPVDTNPSGGAAVVARLGAGATVERRMPASGSPCSPSGQGHQSTGGRTDRSPAVALCAAPIVERCNRMRCERASPSI
jgi:hypothetical protein